MPIQEDTKTIIENLLRKKLLEKLHDYSQETQSAPFHVRLLGTERVAIHSFVHSVYTMLGSSIFEYIAEAIGACNFDQSKAKFRFKGPISERAIVEINRLLPKLRRSSVTANESEENRLIKAICKEGAIGEPQSYTVDLFLKRDNIEYLCEIKTVKPNIDVFEFTKGKLLRWKASRYYVDDSIEVKSLLCIPYNPEAPNPYGRWTLQGLFDLENEVLVADEFWNFLGGDNTYEELLNIFEIIGIELRNEIDMRFRDFE
jgi:type II restriction enzyme